MVYFIAGMGGGLQLRWGDNLVEVFSPNEFSKQTRRPVLAENRLCDARGAFECQQSYMLRVGPKTAEIDYAAGRCRRRNESKDLYVGTTKLEFTDKTRTSVSAVLWKDPDQVEFDRDWVIDCSWHARPLRPFHLTKSRKKSPRTPRLTESRPEQGPFRDALIDLYEGRCCITGCHLPDVLEAAHIMPFSEAGSSDPRNGLLMRADLHLLFDADLLAINPSTYGVHLKRGVDCHPEYRGLKRKIQLPRRRQYGPASEALESRWKKFRA